MENMSLGVSHQIIPKQTRLKSAIKIGIYIFLMILSAFIFSIYVDKEALQEIVQSMGFLGIIIYFIIEVIYVTLTPLLNTAILIASGYIFGGHLGFIINFLATTLGLFLIVFLVKRYGRSLLQKVVSHKFYRNFDRIVQKIGPATLLIVYVLPFTPDDELTYLVAAGPVKFRRFIIPILLGSLAKAAYSYIGDLGAEGIIIALYARVILLVIGLIAVGLQEHGIRKLNPK